MGFRDALVLGRTKAVAINEASLILTRPTTTKSATTGGPTVGTPVILTAQAARLVKPRPGIDPEQITVGAKITKVDWLLLFESAAADVAIGDTFTHPASLKKCTVIGTDVSQSEASTATVTALASEVK